MPSDEPVVEVRLRRKLEELVGPEETDVLMDRPRGGWSALVTKEDLALSLAALEARTDAHFESLEARTDARFDMVDARFREFEARFEAMEARFEARFEALEVMMDTRFSAQTDAWRREIAEAFRAQTWRLVAAMTGLGAVIVAALRV
jgi:hypothetical protein